VFISYLKIALRNLKKHKGYSFSNIIGLAIGMACFILIVALVENELCSRLISKRF
jgi:putative ABC transport system permease protein